MKWLINYFRECFCSHDYEIEEQYCTSSTDFGVSKQGEKVYLRCKKCGYHKNHWKY